MNLVRNLALASAFLLPICAWVPTPATAQYDGSSPDSSIDVYERAYFDPFAPQTALDIVLRIPGFAFDGGDGVRGFAGAAGNVLIDGDRPAAKSGGLTRVLEQIPADQVMRVELSRGGAALGETGGQGLVANLVLDSDGRSGGWALGARENSGGDLLPFATSQFSGPAGPWRINASGVAVFTRPLSNSLRVSRDASGALIRVERTPSSGQSTSLSLSAEAVRDVADGEVSVNGRLRYYGFDREDLRAIYETRFPDGARDAGRRFVVDTEDWGGELSAELRRPVDSGRWEWVTLALASVDRVDQLVDSIELDGGDEFVGGERFVLDRRPMEILARTAVARSSGEVRPEFGAEIAFNQVDSETRFLRAISEHRFEPIESGLESVTVEELRAEIFANANISLARKWRVEGGVSAEASRIAVSGDASEDKTLVYLKPSIAVVRDITERTELRASLRRRVEQLSFNAFAASAQLIDDRRFEGNADIEPATAFSAALALDYRGATGGAINVELFHERRRNVLEQALLDDARAGLANVGQARLTGVNIDFTVPLSRVLAGARLEASVSAARSSISDPITGRERQLDGFTERSGRVSFRQDLENAKVSWGVTYNDASDAIAYFASETSTTGCRDSMNAFAETTRYAGLKMRLQADQLLGGDECGERRFFVPNRNGAFAGSQQIETSAKRQITFVVQGSF